MTAKADDLPTISRQECLLHFVSGLSTDDGAKGSNGCAPCKGGAFQWVQGPPGEMLQPEVIGAVTEVTKWLKPSIERATNSGGSTSVQAVTRVNAE